MERMFRRVVWVGDWAIERGRSLRWCGRHETGCIAMEPASCRDDLFHALIRHDISTGKFLLVHSCSPSLV